MLNKWILIFFSIFLFNIVKAEPPFDAEYGHHPGKEVSKSSNVNTVVDDVLSIILQEGFAGAIIVILFAWTFKVDKANRAEQKETTAKFEEISKECSQHMASVSVKLENLEREVEQFKQLEILRKS